VASDGEIVNCLTNSLVEHDADGVFVRTVAVYTERSDQSRVDWKYRQLYRSTPAMLHTVDADGCIVTVTDHWLQKMAYARDEVVGRSIMDFYSEADRKRFAEGRLQDVISGGEFSNQERQMVTKNGQVLDLVMSAISDRDESAASTACWLHRKMLRSASARRENCAQPSPRMRGSGKRLNRSATTCGKKSMYR
jgi:PAS domain S-box-containing protein